MARRKQSVAEDMVDVTATMPWWVGVVLAIVSYMALHWYAGTPIETKGASPNLSAQFGHMLAGVFQYALPVIFLAGAAISALGRRKRNALHALTASAGTRDALDSMTWLEFEQVVGEYFRRKGFAVTETGGGGSDGGVDLIASRGADRYYVQCKQWKARQVGVAIVRALYGVMAANNVAGGYVVTSGTFTDEAKRFAEGREIQLIAGKELAALIQHQATGVVQNPAPTLTTAPLCPNCAGRMVLRKAQRGSNAGNAFWGCLRFPGCRGTRPAT
jgi:restriction system protein